jgi:glycosyltransferase involved in cell wall biosynthesis
MVPSIVIDGRMLGQPQCFGIARVILEMVAHFPAAGGTPIRLLRPPVLPGWMSFDRLPPFVDIVTSNAPITSPHRISEVSSQLRSLNAGVVFEPYHALAPLWAPCPIVVTVHDCIFEADLRLTGGRAKQLAYVANTARALRRAAAVAVPSTATAAAIGGFYRKVPPVTVCPNGVDATAFDVDEAATDRARAVLGLPDRFVLNVGSRRPHKNQAVLLRALALMDSSVSLVLVGRPDPRVEDEVGRLTDELGLRGRVREIETIPDDLLAGTYRASGAFAFPSVAEGFGLPLLEAMAAGTPVVASALPVIAEVTRDAAILVSPHDPATWATTLTGVLNDRELRRTMISRGTRVATSAGWTVGAERLHALLTRVATGGSAA